MKAPTPRGGVAPAWAVPIRRHLRSVRGKERREHHHFARATGESFRDGFGEVCTVSALRFIFQLPPIIEFAQSRSFLVRNDTG